MKIYFLLGKILIISALLIIANNDLRLHDKASREIFVDKYHTWLSRLFDQGRELSGYVIKSHWLPSVEESTGDASLERPTGLDEPEPQVVEKID